ncbi:hypothetical protein [Methanobrevibacter arboriphilus]|uniref:hypothetical protein n=1 Tax=Methanobrevibacter arboriphilus TaxID=39441 RepID=UPI000ADAE9DC|nr:hypothetical protein [Methanobrevibacter arboriphilus]
MPIAIKIFVSGSFLNPQEISKEVRCEILETISKIDEIKEVIVESRPEYVKKRSY